MSAATHMPARADRPALSAAQKFLLACVFLLGIASLWSLAAKLHFALTNQYFATSGCEGAPIYSIWKVQHGHPLYESPKQPTMPLTVYNYLFYVVYGNILKLLNVSAEGMLPVTKLISLAFAGVGAWLHWRLLRQVLDIRMMPAAVAWAGRVLVLVMWFGTGTISWWALTARPDIGALVMTVAALHCALLGVDRSSARWMAVAAVFFYLAWSFKQAAVWGLGGVWLFLLLRERNWRLLLALTLPYCALVALTLGVGGREYFDTIIGIPSKSPLFLSRSLAKSLLEVMLPNALAWGCLALAPALWRAPSASPQTKRLLPLLFWVAVFSGVMGTIAVGRDGSERNHLFEGLLWVWTVAIVVVLRLVDAAAAMPAWKIRLAGGLAALSLALPVAQAVYPRVEGRFIHWNVTFADQETYARKAELARIVRQLPQPMIVMDDILAQPWFTTSNRYPAVVLDQWVYFRAESFGLFAKSNGLPRLFQSNYFAAILLQPGNSLHRDAVAAGYREAPLPPEQKPWLLLLRQ